MTFLFFSLYLTSCFFILLFRSNHFVEGHLRGDLTEITNSEVDIFQKEADLSTTTDYTTYNYKVSEFDNGKTIQTVTSSISNIPYHEWLALKDFYNSTNGNRWYWKGRTSKWNFTNYAINNPCKDNWVGITCSCYYHQNAHYSIYYTYSYISPLETHCNIRKLILINHYLYGTISSSIKQLTYLRRLNLRRNTLFGSIPEEIGFLSNLTSIVLASNSLSGPIPNSIGKLTNMLYISLRSNYLTGTLPSSLSLLTKLTDLRPYDNLITGTIPSALGGLTSCRNFYLNSNFLTGTIPSALGNLKLLVLNLGYNRLVGTIPSNLQSVGIILGGSIFNLSTSTFQTTKDNHFRGPIPSMYCQSKNLIYFVMPIESNESTCYPICLYYKLNQEYIKGTNHCSGPEDIALCDIVESTNIKQIAKNINNNKITQSQIISSPHPIPFGYKYTKLISVNAYLTNAESYTVSMNNEFFTCALPPGEFIQICPFDDAVIQTHTCFILTCNSQPIIVTKNSFLIIYNSKNFFYVRNGFEILIVATIGFVEWICVSGTAINYCDWTGVNCLGGSVYQIVLNGFGIAGSIPSSISLLKNLHTLNLRYNKLQNVIPSSISNLSVLNTLFLENNMLTGKIPNSLINLSKLSFCNLQGNKLTGQIPTGVISMKSLQFFSVSNNQLTGQVGRPLCLFARNLSLQVFGNQIGCFQQCGDDYLKDQIALCVPTQSPSLAPSLNNGSSDFTIIIVIISVSIFGGLALLAFAIYYFLIRKQYKTYQQLKKELAMSKVLQKSVLEQLPIHALLLSYSVTDGTSISSDEFIKDFTSLLESRAETVGEVDFDNRTVIDIVLEHYGSLINDEVLLILLKHCLPVKLDQDSNLQYIDEMSHGYVWIKVISSNLVLSSVVGRILDDNPFICAPLSQVTDSVGRSALDVSTPECRKLILYSLYFLKRFEILTTIKPHYQSKTCIIHVAIDHNNIDLKNRVVLKFMKHEDSYLNEIKIRKEANFDVRFVIDVTDHYRSDEDIKYKAAINQRGLSSYPFMIVMPAGDRNLNEIVSNGEILDQADFYNTRQIVGQIAKCLNHIHSKGFIHGDLKPKNILRTEGSYLLIDFDGGAKIGKEYPFIKLSTAYSPPEFLIKNDDTGEFELISSTPLEIENQSDKVHMQDISIKIAEPNLSVLSDNESNNKSIRMQDLFTKKDNSVFQIEIERITKSLEKNRISNRFLEKTVEKSKILLDKTRLRSTIETVEEKLSSISMYDNSKHNCTIQSNPNKKVLIADPAHDSWSLGMLIYFLVTNVTFFLCDSVGENICNMNDFKMLYTFHDSFKRDVLNKVSDLQARNLIANLLHKDPSKRLSMSKVLNHPFLTRKTPSRMIGDKAEFCIFLSYRVISDSQYVEMIYNGMINKGLKVWWDKKCLVLGKSWEEGFIEGLCKTKVFAPILSRGTFGSQNFLNLTNSSSIDNVLLEYRLAAELQKRNMIDLICPIFIGDYDKNTNCYSNYFKSGCHPDLKKFSHVVVQSIEDRVCEVLDSQCFGTPLINKISVKDIIDNITVNQGNKDKSLVEAVLKISSAVESLNENMLQQVEDELHIVDLIMSKREISSHEYSRIKKALESVKEKTSSSVPNSKVTNEDVSNNKPVTRVLFPDK